MALVIKSFTKTTTTKSTLTLLAHTRPNKNVKHIYHRGVFTALLMMKKRKRYYRLTLTTTTKGDRLSSLLGVLVSGKEKERRE